MVSDGRSKERKHRHSSNIGLQLDLGVQSDSFGYNSIASKSFLPLPKIGRTNMRPLFRRMGMGLLLCVLGSAPGLAQGWQHIGKVEHFATFKEGLQEGVELTAGQAKVRVTQFYNGVIRVRVAPNGHFPKDFSWALAEAPLNYISGPVQIHDGKNEVKMIAGSVHVSIAKSPLLITFSDASGNVLLADEPSLPMAWDGSRVHVWKQM